MEATPWRQLLLAPRITMESLRAAFLLAMNEYDSRVAISQNPSNPALCDVRTAAGKAFTANLDGLHADLLRAAPPQRERLLLQRVAATAETARQDGPAGLESVVPTVKSAEWVAQARNRAPDLAAEPIAGDLSVVYAFDRAASMAYARWRELEALTLDKRRLRDAALGNLRARLPARLGRRGDAKCFLFIAGGNFEASLILLDEVWDDLRGSLPGDAVVCVPARDICLVTSTGTAGGVRSLISLRDRIRAQGEPSYSISATLLRRRGGGWTPHQDGEERN